MIDLEQYLGFEPKRLVYFAGTTICTTVVVTLAYCLIFGFDNWRTDMTNSTKMMLSAATVPMGQAAAAPYATRAGGGAAAGQYVCPTDGAVGLPLFDAAGMPHCPMCGQIMQCNTGAGNNFTLAAGAG